MGVTGPRILVVDDDASIRGALHVALSKSGYEVVEARDGADALRQWGLQRTDLVITDLHMPGKDGLEVILELRARSPEARIIAMSDGGQTQHIELLGDARLLGAVLTLRKPFTLADMMSTVTRALNPAHQPEPQ